MTNFQPIKKGLISRELLLFAGPLGLGVVISLLGVVVLTWPTWQSLSRDLQALTVLQEQRDRIPLLRQELAKLKGEIQRQEEKKDLILQLIEGSGDVSTFMTQLAIEAQRVGIQLDGYEPIIESAASCAPPKPSSEKSAEAAKEKSQPPQAPPDPILCASPSLEKVSLLLTARGNGPTLQNFLRRLEKLSLLVVQRDLSFKSDPQETPASMSPSTRVSTPPVVMRLTLSLYRRAPNPAKPAKDNPSASRASSSQTTGT